MNDTDARLWHPWLRINRVLRVMLQTRWSAEAWSQVRVEFRKALALRSQIRRVQWRVESDRVWMTCMCGAAINRDADDD
jgi:hypothetical protein